MSCFSLNEAPDTDNQFSRKPRGRPKPPELSESLPPEFGSPQFEPEPDISSSLDEAIGVLLRLRTLDIQMKGTGVFENKTLATSTTNRLQNLTHQACVEFSQMLGPSIQPLDQIVTILERTLNEVSAYTPRSEHETRSIENEISSRLEQCTLKTQYDINHHLSLQTERQVTITPRESTTTFFQGAHNFTVNGGHFGQPDQNVEKQYRRILWILIFNTGVLFS